MPDYIDKINVNGTEYNIVDDVSGYSKTDTITGWYGTCSTTASTAQKEVTCSGFVLSTGAIIGINFSTANTNSAPMLNINNTGSKYIYVGGASASADNVLKWSAYTTIYVMYDGNRYRYITSISASNIAPARGANTWIGTSNTTASTQAKTSTVDNYVLTKGSLVSITFSTANTYASAKITLNINSTGAKDVYYNGTVTSSTNTLLWDANTTLTFVYDGTGYVCICMSRAGSSYTATSPVNITSDVISLSDGYGDIQNPYGTKNEHYVLAGGSSTIASFDDVVMPIDPNGGMQEVTTEPIVLSAGTYTYSLHCVAPATSIAKGINLVYYNGSNYYYVASVPSTTNAIDTDLSGEITLDATTSVNLYIRIGVNGGYYPILNATFTNIKLSSSSPSAPEFRALTNDDLPAIGNIQNTGALQTTDVIIATGDKLVVTDASDSNKVARASISFDTTNTTSYLRKDGTWATPSNESDTFKITLSYNNDEYTIDRTYAEVEAAVLANKYVYIYDNTLTVEAGYQGSTIIAPFACMAPSEDWFFFYTIVLDYNSEETIVRYLLADDGVWVDQYSLAPELPYVNTGDNGKVLKVVNGAWSAATESSGGGLFLVNFSLGATLGSYTADKTFAQIVSAVDSGSVVMGQYQNEYFSLTYFYEGDEQTDGDVRFERYSNNLGSIEWFGMDSQGQITYGNERPWEAYTDSAIGNAMAASY